MPERKQKKCLNKHYVRAFLDIRILAHVITGLKVAYKSRYCIGLKLLKMFPNVKYTNRCEHQAWLKKIMGPMHIFFLSNNGELI